MGIKRKLSEYQRKRVKELIAAVVLLAAALALLLSGMVLNPFYIARPGTDQELRADYEKGIDYIECRNMELEFTGYYKLDGQDKIKYNCYVGKLDQQKYFVFVPYDARNEDETLQVLESYSFVGRVREDSDLFRMVAQDYDMTEEEFRDNYGVSDLVLDEAEGKYQEVLIIWLILLSMLVGYSCYLCWLIFKK